MPLVPTRQNNMTGGEFDPLLIAREDTTFYRNAVSVAENIVVQPQGGATVRGALTPVMRKRGALAALERKHGLGVHGLLRDRQVFWVGERKRI